MEELFEQYKKDFSMSYIENNTEYYNYHGTNLTLEQIHKCETNHMTKACVVDDGTVIKGIFALNPWECTYDDGTFVKFILKENPSIKTEGYWCEDPWGKKKIYCTKSILYK